MPKKDEIPDADPILLGMLALMAADRAERNPEPAVPTELVLDAVGLPPAQIAAVARKNPDAVRMRITRAKTAAKKGKSKK